MSEPRPKVTVFAAGCFNRLHEAHVRMLRHARSLGDELVVILSNDAHNRKPNAVPAETRRSRLESLGIADRVLIGHADSFARTVREVKPQIVTLGYDQRLPDEETEKALRDVGARVVVLPWYPGKECSL